MALALLSLFLVLTPGPSTATAADQDETAFEACFVELAPLEDNDTQSDVLSEACFDTETAAEAFRAELESLDGIYVLFTLYEHTNFGGSQYEWWSTSGCAGYYRVNGFSSIGWNDKASSARAACGRTIDLWEHNNQTGAPCA